MSRRNDAGVPTVCRWAIRLAGCLVPWHARDAWLDRWHAGLIHWWTLVERGEVSLRGAREICRGAFSDAFAERFGRIRLREWARGPLFPIACALTAIATLAAATRGLPKTRALVSTALGWHSGAAHNLQLTGARDQLYVHLFALAFACAIGLLLLVIRRLWVSGRGWRFWCLFAAKSVCVLAAVTLLWIDGSAALRRAIPHQGLRVLVGGPLVTFVFFGAFGAAVAWCASDQRRRCPVCLRHLTLPVTMGSWASVFDAPTTEMLCDIGHGRLCICESEPGEPGRWTGLDASWRELFDPAPH